MGFSTPGVLNLALRVLNLVIRVLNLVPGLFFWSFFFVHGRHPRTPAVGPRRAQHRWRVVEHPEAHLALRLRDEDVDAHLGAEGLHSGLHTTADDELVQHLWQVLVQLLQLADTLVLGDGSCPTALYHCIARMGLYWWSLGPRRGHIACGIYGPYEFMVNLSLNPRTMVHSLNYTAKRAPWKRNIPAVGEEVVREAEGRTLVSHHGTLH